MKNWTESLLLNYKNAERMLYRKLEEEQIKRLKIRDRTFDLIELMASSMAHIQIKAIDVRRRFRESTEVRENFCFIAFLYFDIKSQELADRFKLSRQVIHHYCTNVIAKYQIYSDYRENILEFFTEDEMNMMIEKFNAQKRNGNKTERNKTYGKTVRQLQ